MLGGMDYVTESFMKFFACALPVLGICTSKLHTAQVVMVGVSIAGLGFCRPADMRLKMLAWWISVLFVVVISSI